MTAKDKYYIRVKNALVEVTHEVYLAFYRFERQERNQQEKEKRNHVISYDAWDTGERTGQELLTLPDEANVEELAIAAIMSEKLHRCQPFLNRQRKDNRSIGASKTNNRSPAPR